MSFGKEEFTCLYEGQYLYLKCNELEKENSVLRERVRELENAIQKFVLETYKDSDYDDN